MPLKLSKTGAAAIEAGSGKVKKRFASRQKARAYVQAVNLAMARKAGKRVPAPKRR